MCVKATDTEADHPLRTIADELDSLTSRLVHDEAPAFERLADALAEAPRIFVLASGRSGLALQMTAMRLMHLGLDVYVVGDATTPAIAEGDLLLTASGSGTTSSIVSAAEKARSVGARVATITTAADSPLAELASVSITVPAAGKQDRSGHASAQYAGGLFEQSVVLLGDALFHALWHRSGVSADELWPRHANLE